MINFIPSKTKQPDGFIDSKPGGTFAPNEINHDGFSNVRTGGAFSPFPNTQSITTQPTKIFDIDVSLTFINAKMSNGKYSFLFANSVISKDYNVSANMQIRASQISMPDLQKVIMSKVDKKDLKYIKLREYSTSKSIFVFDVDSWLDDALKNVKGRVYLSKYDKEFRLNIQPPKMVMHYGIRVDFSRYVANYFKEYTKKRPQYRNILFDIVPKSYETRMNTHVSNMFDYEYDFNVNRIIIRLKTVYLTGIIFSAFALTQRSNNKNQSFEEMVRKNLSTFPKDKLNKIIPHKFY